MYTRLIADLSEIYRSKRWKKAINLQKRTWITFIT